MAASFDFRRALTFASALGLALYAGRNASAQVYFDGSTSDDFHTASNWDSNIVPGGNTDDIVSIDDGLSAVYSHDTTRLGFLRVGTTAKEHINQATQFGRLTMTGGTIEVIGVNTMAIGRENLGSLNPPINGDYNRDSVVDGADVALWQRTLSSVDNLSADGDHNGQIDAPDLQTWKDGHAKTVSGGEFIMTGASILRANGVLVGERTKGTLSIGPAAQVDSRIWDTTVEPNQFGGTEDMRVGTWGPAYETFGGEPGLDANGFVDVQGKLNAKDLYLSEHGAKGELRLAAGGMVNLNGELIMDLCAGCTSDPQVLAQRSSKVTIVGSGGTFNVGLDPDSMVVDPMPTRATSVRLRRAASFSFTADAGGVTPITLAVNTGEPSGTAEFGGAKLLLNLDAYTSNSPLTLINAPAGNLVGTFGSVTFLGHRTATVSYDTVNGDVVLSNFVAASAAGVANVGAAPEPASLALAIVGSALTLCRRRRQSTLTSATGRCF